MEFEFTKNIKKQDGSCFDFFTFEMKSIHVDYQYTFSTQLRVRYGETDQMGYCYYGNYAEYLEVGRVEALRALGMSYRSLEEKNTMLPVAEFSIKYHSPAKYDDLLTITTSITRITAARIFFDYVITNEDQRVICKAQTTLVFVDREHKKPTPAPEDFLHLIAPYAL
jgi:acyl-CoA thioester hydrolase